MIAVSIVESVVTATIVETPISVLIVESVITATASNDTAIVVSITDNTTTVTIDDVAIIVTIADNTTVVTITDGVATADMTAAIAAHANLTTTAHGGLVASTDPRLTDARTPLAHDLIASHTYTGGAALDVFGLSAPNTIARLTPSSNPGAAAAILATNASGGLMFAADIIGKDFVRTRPGAITRVGGYISSVALTGGRTMTITRDGSGYVSTIADGARTWTFTRDGNNQIASWAVV